MVEEYIKHMQENLELCKTDSYLFDSIKKSRKAQKVYRCKNRINVQLNNSKKLHVSFENSTSFDAARKYIFDYKNIAVLNFANAHYPGGGCLQGACAQEESLCRCSTLYECLIDPILDKQFYSKHKASGWGNSDIIYTPGIKVIGNDKEFFKEADRFTVNIITCAAPNLSSIDTSSKGKRLTIEECLTKRIERIFKVAIDNKTEVLILGAWGCGVFNNPPDIVAKVMSNMCKKYQNALDVVDFAVFDPSPAKKNYNAFAKEYNELKKIFPQSLHFVNNVSVNKQKHMFGVASFMYNEAPKYGLNPKEMFTLGLLHDIGYVGHGFKGHAQEGFKFMKEESYKFYKEILMHDWYPGSTLFDEKEITIEGKLLLAADNCIDNNGDFVGYAGRRKDIASRYGEDAEEFLLKLDKRVEYLKTQGFNY